QVGSACDCHSPRPAHFAFSTGAGEWAQCLENLAGDPMQYSEKFRLLTAIVWCGVAILLIGNHWAIAQVTTGNISGTLRDASGGVVVGASVTAANRETALAHTVQSGTDGHYQIRNLPIGVYDVKAEMTGFQSQLHQGLNLEVGQEAV